jgi:hypothetical protein
MTLKNMALRPHRATSAYLRMSRHGAAPVEEINQLPQSETNSEQICSKAKQMWNRPSPSPENHDGHLQN